MLPAKKLLKTILVIGIALILGLLITVFLKYREYSDNPAKLVEAIPEGTDIALDDIQHTAVKDGRKEWSLKAASARYSDDAKEARFDDVEVIFFMENDRQVMVKGRQGSLDTQTNNIEISGDVIVRDADYQLEAQTLFYDHGQRKLNVPVPVKISGQAFELHADKMTVDLASETAVLEGAVKGSFSEDNTIL